MRPSSHADSIRHAIRLAMGCSSIVAVLGLTAEPAQARYLDNMPPDGNVYAANRAGLGGAVPQAFANGIPSTAITYGAGKLDEIDQKFYYAFYDPASAAGGGVATWWDDSDNPSNVSADQAGLFCSLPMSYTGSGGEKYKRSVKGTPIPDFLFGTLVRVTNAHTGQWIVCALIDRGPALETGAAIDLSSDAKVHLGMKPGNNGINTFVYYEIVRNEYDPTYATVRPVR
jgi:rare lipoprotein A (peptidoglycan hydrolase)